MQQTHLNRYEKIMIAVKGFFWVAGLLAAGSDSNFMPWGNGIGVVLFAVSSFSLGKQSVNARSASEPAGNPGFYRKSDKKGTLRRSLFIPVTSL